MEKRYKLLNDDGTLEELVDVKWPEGWENDDIDPISLVRIETDADEELETSPPPPKQKTCQGVKTNVIVFDSLLI